MSDPLTPQERHAFDVLRNVKPWKSPDFGDSERLARGAIRWLIGRDAVADDEPEAVEALRALVALYELADARALARDLERREFVERCERKISAAESAERGAQHGPAR